MARHTSVVIVLSMLMRTGLAKGLLECSGTYTSPAGTIKSPPPSSSLTGDVIDCVYVIRSPVGYRVTLNFTTFDLENSTDCVINYVELRDGDSQTSPSFGGRSCGRDNPGLVRSFGSSMRVRYFSYPNVTRPTCFQATYSMGVHDDAFFLITSNDGAIFRMDPVTRSNYKVPIAARLFNPIAVDYDPVEGRIYWTEVAHIISNSIRSTRINGSDVKVVKRLGINAVLDGLAIDPLSRLLFYTDSGNKEIVMMSLKTWAFRTIINTTLDKPRAIVLEFYRGIMFWTDWGTPPKIERANYDGTDRRVIVNYILLLINALALDAENDRLYWVDAGTDMIESCNTDGGERTTLMTVPPTFHFFGLALYNDSLYITDWPQGVSRRNQSLIIHYKIGESEASVFGSVASRLNDIHAHHTAVFHKDAPALTISPKPVTTTDLSMPRTSVTHLSMPRTSVTHLSMPRTSVTHLSMPRTSVTLTSEPTTKQLPVGATLSAQPTDVALVAAVSAIGGAVVIVLLVIVVAAIIIIQKRPNNEQPKRQLSEENTYSALGYQPRDMVFKSHTSGQVSLTLPGDRTSDYCEVDDLVPPNLEGPDSDDYLHPVEEHPPLPTAPPPCSRQAEPNQSEYIHPTTNPDHAYFRVKV